MRNTEGTIIRGSVFAFASAAVAAVAGLLFLAAADFDLSAAADPPVYLEAGHGDLLRWAAITDMIGYYLLFAVVAIAIHRSMRARGTGDADLTLVAGLFYSVVGAIAAALLASVVAPIVHPGMQVAPDGFAVALTNGIFKGLWQTLESIPAALWWLLIAVRWANNRTTRTASIIMGLACIAEVIGRTVGPSQLAIVAATIFVIGWVPAIVMVGMQLRGEERENVR